MKLTFTVPTIAASTTLRLAPGHGFGLTLQGNAGEGYVVQTSTNLVEWSKATDGIIYGNEVEWTDPDALLVPVRFYRLLPVP